MKASSIILSLCMGLALSACVTKQTYNTEVGIANSYQALSNKLSNELGADQAQITQLQNQLKVTMVNDVLFPEGGWRLSPQGEATLGKIAPTLSNLPGQQIVVQGFTDNLPVEGELKQRFQSNLGLSSARADDVVRYLISQGVPAASISAQGFGDARPVQSNDTAQGRAQNRRVEIVIAAASSQR